MTLEAEPGKGKSKPFAKNQEESMSDNRRANAKSQSKEGLGVFRGKKGIGC